MEDSAHIGVVVYDRRSRPDAMLAALVPKLQARGLRIAGLLQEATDGDRSCCASLFVEDIATGRRVQIFERRGTGTRGCRLDLSGLADIAALLRRAIVGRPDLLFVNRFGRQEAEGRGLTDEIAAAAVAGIPIVVAVGAALLDAWSSFAGEDWVRLDGPDELEAWCLRQVVAGAGARLGRIPEVEHVTA